MSERAPHGIGPGAGARGQGGGCALIGARREGAGGQNRRAIRAGAPHTRFFPSTIVGE